ncbi:hypothetical protein PN498_00715 [Oscillatoria sp. CS-180]|uniref:hypothetical protein n=1 Tax=Oscillatoria sp. CS-180 TaxID=3021720 RepID=UPI00232AA75C|nr:hypothetical protein [Oscillatoria sp. CS-180]MDB9524494.1 hypothetical protein [Oscillatoria sp. CS-180]
MSSSGAKPFKNNWEYLKVELRWLDRVLMMAVSRKRQDDKTIHQVANNSADKITSHWWKGIISVSRGIDDREGPPPKSPAKSVPTASYSQQLEARIQASYEAKIILALPLLRDRLGLSEVEKNIVLMAIAPEINRRYGRLYDYLQEEEGALADLPTVDLCLRILCRNDNDWQQTRAKLTATHSLAHRGLVEWIGDEDGTLLSQQVRVSDPLARFLLSDHPSEKVLSSLLAETGIEDNVFISDSILTSTAEQASATSSELPLEEESSGQPQNPTLSSQVEVSWETLVLPKKLIHQLQHLGRQTVQRQQGPMMGLIVLLVGDTGTGKTTAAAAIASQINQALTCVDLATLSPEQYPGVLTDSPNENSSLLLIKQGKHWFGRNSQVDQSWLHQWWQWRKQFGLTLVSVKSLETVRPSWRQSFDGILHFPRPDKKGRCRLWAQSFAPEFNTQRLSWSELAEQLPLTGGDIQTIAQTIQLDLQERQRSTVTLQALRDALRLHHPHLELKTR